MTNPDLKSPRAMVLKATLLIILGLLASAILLLGSPDLPTAAKSAALLAVAVWAFARAYYFAFYVVTNYIDPTYHYAGMFSALLHALKRRP